MAAVRQKKAHLPSAKPPIRRKREGSRSISVTLPRRKCEKADITTAISTSNGKAPTPDLMANLARNVENNFATLFHPDYEYTLFTRAWV